MDVSEFTVRKFSCTSNPWRIVHAPTDREVSIPKVLTNADGQLVVYNGPACFPRKRDALAWLREELPKLLTPGPAPGAERLRTR